VLVFPLFFDFRNFTGLFSVDTLWYFADVNLFIICFRAVISLSVKIAISRRDGR
jgi:hypothetical protein